ncbi:MAG: zinc-dependent peptidase [Hylemonella sp.]|nr:zinc-dependent peptidase [Hylemonella sp.]
MLKPLWHSLLRCLAHPTGTAPVIPDALWQQVLSDVPFLTSLSPAELLRLRQLSAFFLKDKEFHGAQGLLITDAMALAIAAQACLPLVHLGDGRTALRWYDEFVGIVVHPDQVVAQREFTDDTGLVHSYREVLAGEACEQGPVTLSWHDVTSASPEHGYNVVIHEFVHKIDMRDGVVDGCPPLPANFMAMGSVRQARAHWFETLEAAYDDFRDQVIRAERFGAAPPWLDPYGAESLSEFFAVASEAYFVNRRRFSNEMPGLLTLFDAFFRPSGA